MNHDKPLNKDTEPAKTPDRDQPGVTDDIQRVGRNIVNAFTVERDMSLAEGAGAPGSIAAGDQRILDEHEHDRERPQEEDAE